MAYGFDRWIVALQQTTTRAFAITSYLWLSSIANLILACALLFVAWFVNFRATKRKMVSVTFLVIGFLVTFASALIFTAFSTLPPLGIAEYVNPYSRVVFVAGLITVMGVAGFISRKSHNV
jgi:hypothetical protein